MVDLAAHNVSTAGMGVGANMLETGKSIPLFQGKDAVPKTIDGLQNPKLGKALGRFGSILGIMGGYDQIQDGVREIIDPTKIGAEGVGGGFDVTAGIGSVLSGVIGLGGSLGIGACTAGVLPAAAAVGGGLAAGIGLAQSGNEYISDTGLLGETTGANGETRGRNWTEWAGDVAQDAHDSALESNTDPHHRDSEAAKAYYYSLMGATVAGGVGATVTGALGMNEALYNSQKSAGSGLAERLGAEKGGTVSDLAGGAALIGSPLGMAAATGELAMDAGGALIDLFRSDSD